MGENQSTEQHPVIQKPAGIPTHNRSQLANPAIRPSASVNSTVMWFID